MPIDSKLSALRRRGSITVLAGACAALAACDPKLPTPGPPQPKADEVVQTSAVVAGTGAWGAAWWRLRAVRRVA